MKLINRMTDQIKFLVSEIDQIDVNGAGFQKVRLSSVEHANYLFGMVCRLPLGRFLPIHLVLSDYLTLYFISARCPRAPFSKANLLFSDPRPPL